VPLADAYLRRIRAVVGPHQRLFQRTLQLGKGKGRAMRTIYVQRTAHS
jgi:hypothetical protein